MLEVKSLMVYSKIDNYKTFAIKDKEIFDENIGIRLAIEKILKNKRVESHFSLLFKSICQGRSSLRPIHITPFHFQELHQVTHIHLYKDLPLVNQFLHGLFLIFQRDF